MKPITEAEFARFQRFIFDAAGITLSSSKQALVSGRLGKRLDELPDPELLSHHLDRNHHHQGNRQQE